MPVELDADSGKALREVTHGVLRVGRGSVLGPDTWRRTFWWELTLDCGHMVERTARYQKAVRGQMAGRRTSADVMPMQRRARCDDCAGAADPARQASRG